MSRHRFAHRLYVHAETAAKKVPPIGENRIVPRILRHGCAFHRLEATGDVSKHEMDTKFLQQSTLRSRPIL